MVTHKEALRVAREAVRERMASMSQFLSLEDLYDEQDEIQLRAYLDARGLVMVPKEPTQAMLDEVTAPDQSEPFSDVTMSGVYRQMLAAAPDLLEALRDFVSGYPEDVHVDKDSLVGKARAAIAKAEGRS